jgi:hypothetical protein
MSAAMFSFFVAAARGAVWMRQAYARQEPLEGTP